MLRATGDHHEEGATAVRLNRQARTTSRLEAYLRMHARTGATRATLALRLGALLTPVAGCGTTRNNNRAHAVAVIAQRPPRPGLIAFRRFFDPAHHTGAIFTIQADGRGERQVSHPPRGSVGSLNGPPGFMPDAWAFIFDRTDAHSNGSPWRVNADGSDERRLPSLSGMPGDGWPSVSPDGRKIAVARAWGTQDEYQDLKSGLYVMSSDGSSPTLVADFGYRADVGGATWSPDGNWIVFANNGTGGADDLFVMHANGSSITPLTRTRAWESAGTWLP